MNKKFFAALRDLSEDKNIPVQYLLEKVEAALISAYKKEYGSAVNVRVEINPEKDDLRIFQQKTVVDEVADPDTEISLEEARKTKSRIKVGKIWEKEVKPENFRRLSAVAAKSVIIQGIREGERQAMQREYEDKKGEIITARINVVDKETGNAVIETRLGSDNTLVLHKSEQIPGEELYEGEEIKVYVVDVSKETKGRVAVVSRCHPDFVTCLFEERIPEIAEGLVVIKGKAREAGSRTKLSVQSLEEGLDPVGTCVGQQGSRIESILRQINNEKVDIVKYSDKPEEYVAAALAPAKVNEVVMLDERSCRVFVDEDQLSLAIGKEGQNARLAAKLTGIKIDIKV